MKNIFLTSLVLLVGSVSFADQCAYITKAQAQKAVEALMSTQKIQALCEPCGETKAVEIKVESLGYQKAGMDKTYTEVVINGNGIDLAYTYVNGLNLAKLVGCSAHDVSPAIK